MKGPCAAQGCDESRVMGYAIMQWEGVYHHRWYCLEHRTLVQEIAGAVNRVYMHRVMRNRRETSSQERQSVADIVRRANYEERRSQLLRPELFPEIDLNQ